jgi:hypothetical protein
MQPISHPRLSNELFYHIDNMIMKLYTYHEHGHPEMRSIRMEVVERSPDIVASVAIEEELSPRNHY